MSTQAAERGLNYNIRFVNLNPYTDAEIIKEHWVDSIRPMLAKAIKRQPLPIEETVDDVFDKFLNGIYGLYLIYNGKDLTGVIVLTTQMHGAVKSLGIAYMGGKNMLSWANTVHACIEKLAANNGYDQIECVTNATIAKLFKSRYGYVQRYYMTKGIDHG